MTIYAFPIHGNDQAFGPTSWSETLTPDQVDALVVQANNVKPTTGGIVRDASTQENDTKIRNVTTRTLTVDDFGWVFDMMFPYIQDANRCYQFDLHGFMESMQFLHYGEDIGGGHYHWHTDCGPGISTRKLTLIVQLTDPAEYTGCETEVMFNNYIDNRKGAITVFPSWMPHRVMPLKTGKRDVLVAWVNGPTFR